jgi:hypothetical protein
MILAIPSRYLAAMSWVTHATPGLMVEATAAEAVTLSHEGSVHQWQPTDSALAAVISDDRLFVITGRLSSSEREHLEAGGVPYLDAAGHLFIKAPGTLVRIDAPAARSTRTSYERTDGLGYGGIRIVQELLAEPDTTWTISKVEALSRVSRARASQVLQLLERNGLLAADEQRPGVNRRILDRRTLLDWLEKDTRARKARPRLECAVYGLDGIDVARRASDTLHDAGIPHALTGSIAAALKGTRVLTSDTVWIRIDPDVPLAYAAERLDAIAPARPGNLMLIHDMGRVGTVGGDYPLSPDRVARDTRIYLDMLNEPRGESAAELFRDTLFSDSQPS